MKKIFFSFAALFSAVACANVQVDVKLMCNGKMMMQGRMVMNDPCRAQDEPCDNVRSCCIDECKDGRLQCRLVEACNDAAKCCVTVEKRTPCGTMEVICEEEMMAPWDKETEMPVMCKDGEDWKLHVFARKD